MKNNLVLALIVTGVLTLVIYALFETVREPKDFSAEKMYDEKTDITTVTAKIRVLNEGFAGPPRALIQDKKLKLALGSLNSHLEMCVDKKGDLLSQKKSIDNEILDYLIRASSLDESNAILAAMVDNDVINVPRAFYIMNNVHHRAVANEYTPVEVVSGQRLVGDVGSLVKEYKDLISRLNSNDPVKLSEVLQLRGTLPKLVVDFGSKKQVMTTDHLLARVLSDMSLSELKEAISIETFDQTVLLYLMEQNVGSDKLRLIVDRTEFNHNYVFDSEGQMTNAKNKAISLGDYDTLEVLMEKEGTNKFPFDTSGLNHLVADLLSQKDFDVSLSQANIVSLLSSNSEQLHLFYNNTQGDYQVLGSNMRAILDQSQVDYLKSYGISVKLVDKSTIQGHTQAFAGNSAFLVLIDEWKVARTSGRDIDRQCQDLQRQYEAFVPTFRDSRKRLNALVNKKLSFYENIDILAKESPALVDNFYIANMFDNKGIDLNVLTEALNTIKTGSLSSALSIMEQSQFSPIEQTFLANSLCISGGINNLISKLSLFDTIYFEGIHYVDCIGEYPDKNVLIKHYFNTQKSSPSLVYWQVSQRDYSAAYASLSDNIDTYGYPQGRDALALFLDHKSMSDLTYSEVEQSLLAELLTITELTDMHYSRLHRLKVTNVNVFQNMVSINGRVAESINYNFSAFR